MSALTIFQFEQQSIRTGEIDGQAVFCLLDLLRAMESKTAAHKARYSLEEVFGKEGVFELPLQTAGGVQNAAFVFESGATYLISRSRTDAGKKLNQWIHSDVLPSIRKTGKYTASLSESDKLALMAEGFLRERAEKMALTAQIEADEPATTLGKAIAKAPNNIRIGDFAKSIGMGQNRILTNFEMMALFSEPAHYLTSDSLTTNIL